MEDVWFEVVVEIPKGSRNKHEIDHDTGAFLARPALEPSKSTEVDQWADRAIALEEIAAARARYAAHLAS